MASVNMKPVVKSNRVFPCFSTHFQKGRLSPKDPNGELASGNMQEMTQLRRRKPQQQTGGFSGEGSISFAEISNTNSAAGNMYKMVLYEGLKIGLVKRLHMIQPK